MFSATFPRAMEALARFSECITPDDDDVYDLSQGHKGPCKVFIIISHDDDDHGDNDDDANLQ